MYGLSEIKIYINQYWAGRVYDLCVYYMTGTPKGSNESGFMEKPHLFSMAVIYKVALHVYVYLMFGLI